MFCTSGPIVVIVAWAGDKLSSGQTDDWRTHTHTHTHRQTQAMTIPEGHNWPRVKAQNHTIPWNRVNLDESCRNWSSLIQSDCLWVPWEHTSTADHNGGQPGCKWTSQIWNVAHCLEALDGGHCAYTYAILQNCRNMMCFYSWIDTLLISPVILMWQLVEKKIYKLLCRGVGWKHTPLWL